MRERKFYLCSQAISNLCVTDIPASWLWPPSSAPTIYPSSQNLRQGVPFTITEKSASAMMRSCLHKRVNLPDAKLGPLLYSTHVLNIFVEVSAWGQIIQLHPWNLTFPTLITQIFFSFILIRLHAWYDLFDFVTSNA